MKAPQTSRLMCEALRFFKMREIVEIIDRDISSGYKYHAGKVGMPYEEAFRLERAIDNQKRQASGHAAM